MMHGIGQIIKSIVSVNPSVCPPHIVLNDMQFDYSFAFSFN